MISRLGRIGFLVALLGVALGASPKDAMAHCRPEPAQSAPGHHDHEPKNTESAEQCPHCPPAECRRHVDCASAGDSFLEVRAPVPAFAASGQLDLAQPITMAAGHPSPPTPPPQPAV